MDDSDDEFKELCGKLLRRVKRNAAEDDGKTSSRGLQNGTKSTTAKTKLKKPKPASKSKNQDGTASKKGGLCSESGGATEGSRIEPEQAAETGLPTEGNSTLALGVVLLPGDPLSAFRGGNEQQRAQPGCIGNGCLQATPTCSYAENSEATCTGDIQVQGVQPHEGTLAAPTVRLQPHSHMKAAPALGVQSHGDTETFQTKGILPKDNMDPAEHSPCQAAFKTAPAEVVHVRAVDRALARMQQFKRADQRRLKHSTEEGPTATTDGQVTEQANNPTLPLMENDRALALALQQDIPSLDTMASLEEEGFYFCQLCQKDLSAMNSSLRQQHMNRCLDEVETSVKLGPVPAAPRIPECPICGKHFITVTSRAAHLKRCAVTMQVSPKMLLQAVQMQTLDSEISLPSVSSSTAGKTKRKGSAKESAPPKKHKASMESSQVEDMLVALVMSRSLLEEENQDESSTMTSSKSEVALPVRMRHGAEKKRRKKTKEAPHPALLIQDPETAIKQIQNRVAALLMEEMEVPCTPALPASRFWDKQALETDWRHSLSEPGRRAVLWQCSTMTDFPPLEFFYTKELVPTLSALTAPQNQKKQAILPSAGSGGQQHHLKAQPSNDLTNSAAQVILRKITKERLSQEDDGTSLSPQCGISSCSQRDQEALQDLMELAGEGLTLTQWKQGMDQNPSIHASGKESVVSDIAPSGFVPLPRENKKLRKRSCHRNPLPLGTLAADFGGMVNNPHLSDVQFQLDCGDILYAHLFVLYARCPRLVELVHDESFLVDEDGEGRSRRVLLNDITSEAACSFLRYLYCASTDISPCSLSDVAALCVRFGVSELLSICENNHLCNPESDGIDSEDELFSDGKEDNHEDSRADNFNELLKSMWVDEDEEVLAELEAEGLEESGRLHENEKVDEDELEEIYEFAATQRKVGLDPSEEDTDGGLESETDSKQNLQHQMGYAFISTEPSSQDLQVNIGMERLPSTPQDSTGKGLQHVIAHESVNVEDAQTIPCSAPRCNNNTGSPVAKSEGESTLEKAQENAAGEHKSPISFQPFVEDQGKDPLIESPLSEHSHVGLNDSYDRMFSDTWDEYMEPSLADHEKSGLGLRVAEQCEISNLSPLRDGLQGTLTLETNHCQRPVVSQSISVLPALGLSPASPNPKRTPPLKANPQGQSSLSESIESDRSAPPPLKLSPQRQSFTFSSLALSSSRTQPSNDSPQKCASPVAASEPSEDGTPISQATPHKLCVQFPSSDPGRSKEPPFFVSPQSQSSPFSTLEAIRSKINGDLFSADAVSQLKRVVMGIAHNYTNKTKQDMDSPTKTQPGSLNKQSSNNLISSLNKEFQNPSLLAEKDDTIIVLDSDEEMECEQQRKKSPLNSSCDMKKKHLQSTYAFGKVEKSPQSVKPKATSVFDFDIEERYSGPSNEACSDVNATPNGCSSSKLKLHLSCEDDQSHDDTVSSLETSWLVPATPLLSRSRDSSSQTTSFQYLSKLSQIYKSGLDASSNHSNTFVNNLSTNMPKANLTFRTSPPAWVVEECAKVPSFGGPLVAKVAEEDLSKNKTLPGSTVKVSATSSLTSSPIPTTVMSHGFSDSANMPPESPSSPPLQGEQSLQKEPSDSSSLEVEDSQGDQAASLPPSSGSLQMDYELPIPVDDCWNLEYLTSVEDKLVDEDKSEPEGLDSANRTSRTSKTNDSESEHWKSPNKRIDLTGIGHVSKSPRQKESGLLEHDTSHQMAESFQNSKLSFLNSNVWEDWDGEDDNLPVFAPLSQRLSTMTPPESILKQKTPVVRKMNQVPEVPITPLPSYSDMDTPKLKKELERFGVRPLPKQKMVLKLREIFQYTHQTMSSDSEEEIPPTQLHSRVNSVCLSQPTPGLSTARQGRSSTVTSKKRKPGISSQPPLDNSSSQPASDNSSERPAKTSQQRCKKPGGGQKTSLTTARKKRTERVSPAKSPLKERLPSITASQESTASSAAGSDISFDSQSSSTNEFDMAFASGEEEDSESITSSQAAVQEKDKSEAVRRYLHLNPDLYQKILLYEPIELAGLQSELKQNGIKMPMGKLLDFLDAHCITFTTAAARKDKLEKKQQRRGKKKVTAKRY